MTAAERKPGKKKKKKKERKEHVHLLDKWLYTSCLCLFFLVSSFNFNSNFKLGNLRLARTLLKNGFCAVYENLTLTLKQESYRKSKHDISPVPFCRFNHSYGRKQEDVKIHVFFWSREDLGTWG